MIDIVEMSPNPFKGDNREILKKIDEKMDLKWNGDDDKIDFPIKRLKNTILKWDIPFYQDSHSI